jgi:hypothetical protein
MPVVIIDLLAVVSFGAASGRDSDAFAWGEEERGLRIGIRLERENVPHTNLFTFTTALKDCIGGPIRVAAGDIWTGPMRPEYEIRDDKKSAWRIAPPHILRTGRVLTHVPLPFFPELKAGEEKVVRRATFVPPVPSGEWEVYAWLLPSTDLRSEDELNRLKAEGVWMNTPLVSGVVRLTVENQEDDRSRLEWVPELPAPGRNPER